MKCTTKKTERFYNFLLTKEDHPDDAEIFSVLPDWVAIVSNVVACHVCAVFRRLSPPEIPSVEQCRVGEGCKAEPKEDQDDADVVAKQVRQLRRGPVASTLWPVLKAMTSSY